MKDAWTVGSSGTVCQAGLINGIPIMVSKTMGSALAYLLSAGYWTPRRWGQCCPAPEQWDNILVGGLKWRPHLCVVPGSRPSDQDGSGVKITDWNLGQTPGTGDQGASHRGLGKVVTLRAELCAHWLSFVSPQTQPHLLPFKSFVRSVRLKNKMKNCDNSL